jgi:predicted NUDIX family phosphoesterase
MNPGRSTVTEEEYITDELKRELFEEVRLVNGCKIVSIEFIGFINDDTIQVGRFHIGLLYNIRVSTREVFINETDKMTAEWVDKLHLEGFYEEMETWSRIALDYLKRSLRKAKGGKRYSVKR